MKKCIFFSSVLTIPKMAGPILKSGPVEVGIQPIIIECVKQECKFWHDEKKECRFIITMQLIEEKLSERKGE